MLSSILNQKGDIPDIVVSLSYVPGNGNPASEDVIDFFEDKGLNIIRVPLKEEDGKNRAIPRNIRAGETDADWILFADSDMVYCPEFFADIKKQLETDKFKKETKVIGADRHSLDIEFSLKYFEEDNRVYPCDVSDGSVIASKWPKKWIRGKETAAGYFQLARVERIKERGGIYSGRKRDVWRRTKSDRQFRCHLGGRVPMNVKPQYHLNHSREDNDSTEQR
tara:strand:- start:5245 stop:5910 length:666 start_codon:yes stop_codon:yes gene_type:complete